MLATLAYFPMLAALWLLLLAPGFQGAALRWRLAPLATAIVGAIGVWFAFNGTNPLTWIFARQTALYVLALALALALASPASTWLAAARLPAGALLRGRHRHRRHLLHHRPLLVRTCG